MQTEYKFDNIGNRKDAKNGGNQLGGLRQSNYTTNSLNQYSQRSVPGAVDVTGTANTAATVTVNNQTTARKADYFYKELAVDNSASPADAQINIVGARNNFGAGGEDAVTEKGGRVFVPQAVEIFTYDDDGNLTSDGRWNYTWDSENRLVSMEARASVPAEAKLRLEFAYDYMARRIQKKVYVWNVGTGTYQLQSTAKFVYDEWNLMAELDATNAVTRSYVWGNDISGSLQGAGGIAGLLLVNGPSISYQVSYDGTGNVAMLVNSGAGSISRSLEYDPFGNTLKSVGQSDDGNPFKFSTKYTDEETSLIYFGYRSYNPLAGRWINRDPAQESGGVNLYSYVGNNSPNLSDKLGLYRFRALFDAFIHKNLGEWADEPGSYNAHFKTDFRDFGEFDENANEKTGNARLYSIIEVESTLIGKLEKQGVIKKFSAAGMSHRRTRSWNPFGTGPWSKPESQTAPVENPNPVIKDIGPCETTVWFKPSAGYPFKASPNIDYDVVFTLKILENKKEISVAITLRFMEDSQLPAWRRRSRLASVMLPAWH